MQLRSFIAERYYAKAVELRRDFPVIIVAYMANPVGIQNTIAVLLEPVSDTSLSLQPERYCRSDRVGSELIGCIVDAGENAKSGNSSSFRYYRIAQLA